MTDIVKLDDVVAQLRALMQQEYLRGRADATRHILAAAQSAAAPNSADQLVRRHVRDDAQLFEPEGHRRRATPGLPDVLIKRVLSLRFPAGASSAEIYRMAADEERQVSLSGVRFALDRGKVAGRYRNQNGQWFLTKAASSEPEEAP